MAVSPVDTRTDRPPPPCGEGLGVGATPKDRIFVSTTPPGGDREPDVRDQLWQSASSLFKTFASTARLMVGVPDYDAYVAHRKAMHPDEPVMTYEAFFRERQDSRYGVNGGKISRCC